MTRNQLMLFVAAIAIIVVIAYATGALGDLTAGFRDGFKAASESGAAR